MDREPLGRRVHLGVELDPRSENELEVVGLDPMGSAARAGVRVSDRLIEIAGKRISSVTELFSVLRGLRPSSPVSFAVDRSGKRHELETALDPMPLEKLTRGSVQLDEITTELGRLRVILTLPEADPPFPVVYVLPGASWSSCEFPLDPEAPLFELVDGLTSLGYATQRLERSGVGDSEGPPCTEIGFERELSAYAAGLQHLQKRAELNLRAVFLLGVSLGGMVAPLIATAEVRGVAVFGTSARRFGEALSGAAERFWRRGGSSEPEVELRLSRLTELHRLVYQTGLTPEQAYTRNPELRPDLESSYSGEQAFGRTVRFFQELDATDLEGAWRRLLCPALAAHAEHDWITTRADALHISELARAGCFVELAGVDHEQRQVGHDSGHGRLAPTVLDTAVAFFDELLP